MKQNRKGFTLIELLAVIVILAIIALIATPIILNMINEARKSSAKSSTLGFVDSIEYYSGFSEANGAGGMDLSEYGTPIPTITSGKTSLTCKKVKNSENKFVWDNEQSENVDSNGTSCSAFMAAVEAKNKGKAPDEAKVVLDEAGKVQTGSTFTFGKLTCDYNGTDVSGCH